MKRLLIIICCFLVFFAGAASAWASCKQVLFSSDNHHHSSGSAHTHAHHADTDQQHSHDAVIHCPTVDEFVPVATFSLRKGDRVERLVGVLIAELPARFAQRWSDRLIHGPPGFEHSSTIPPYLLLSVLRI